MDLGDFRSFIFDSGLDVWACIDMAISVASADHQKELKNRRDGIVQKLYAPAFSICQKCDSHMHIFSGENCNGKESEEIGGKGDMGWGCDYTNQDIRSEKLVIRSEEEEEEEYDKKREVFEIKNLLYSHPQSQSEGRLIEVLKRLVDMDITFKVLKETDIGRHVTRLRKHSSDEVRRLVKILVRKWKDIVDEWVRLSVPEEEEQVTKFRDDKRSPHAQAQVGILPGQAQIHCLTPPKESVNLSSQKESENLAFSAAKRLHGNQPELQKAKKQRIAQAMDFDSMPKTKKATETSNNIVPHIKYW